MTQAARHARQFFRQLPASLQATMQNIRTTAGSALARASAKTGTGEEKLARLLRDQEVQKQIGRLAGTAALDLKTRQAIDAFRQLTEPPPRPSAGDSTVDAFVDHFIDVFDRKISPRLARGTEPGLVRAIVASQVIARCIAELNPGSVQAKDCANALNSYLANTRPGMPQHEGFVSVLKATLLARQ